MSNAQEPQQSAGKRTRLRFFVIPRFQLQMLLPIAVYTAALAAFAAAFVFLPMEHRLDEEPSPDIQALFREQLFEIELRLLPALGFAAFGAAAYALRVSHRAAGPLYRFTRALEMMIQGTYEPVRFRKRDFFPELEVLANELRQKMQALAGRHRDTLVATEVNLRRLAERLENEVVPKWELQESLNNIGGQIRKALGPPRPSA